MATLNRLGSRAALAAEILRRPGGVRQVLTLAAHRAAPASFDQLPLESAVRLAYNVVLRRDPEPAEAEAALAQLRSGAVDRADFLDRLMGRYADFPISVVLRLGYTMLLQREVDPDGEKHALEQLQNGTMDRYGFLDWIRSSGEFRSLGYRMLSASLHTSRCQFIQTLPRAGRILDLGGTSLGDPDGAFVGMGYPYDFEELVLIDLPPDDRHPLYQRPAVDGTVTTRRGPVRYEYHSMIDLSRYDSDSFDLVYSGQTFEHVTEADADLMLKEVHRVLKPGGAFALDTPNGRACRLQQDEFIDPDHEVEYTAPQLEAKLAAADFRLDQAWGLNYVGRSLADGVFSVEEAARNAGLFSEVEDCYLLAYVFRPGAKP